MPSRIASQIPRAHFSQLDSAARNADMCTRMEVISLAADVPPILRRTVRRAAHTAQQSKRESRRRLFSNPLTLRGSSRTGSIGRVGHVLQIGGGGPGERSAGVEIVGNVRSEDNTTDETAALIDREVLPDVAPAE